MLWNEVKEILKHKLPEAVQHLWIEPLTCVRADENQIELACPDKFFCMWVKENYLKIIEESLLQLGKLLQRSIFPFPNKPRMIQGFNYWREAPGNNFAFRQFPKSTQISGICTPSMSLKNLWWGIPTFWPIRHAGRLPVVTIPSGHLCTLMLALDWAKVT